MSMNSPSPQNLDLTQNFSQKTHKECICGETVLENFYDEKKICKKCHNKKRASYSAYKPTFEQRQAYQRKYAYGISPEEFNKLVQDQKGLCAVCLVSLTEVVPHVDHCHDTGVVRGVLCPPCNKTMGFSGDNVERLERMVSYLRSAHA